MRTHIKMHITHTCGFCTLPPSPPRTYTYAPLCPPGKLPKVVTMETGAHGDIRDNACVTLDVLLSEK